MRSISLMLASILVCGVADAALADRPFAPFPAYFALPEGFAVAASRGSSAAFGREEFRYRLAGQRDMTTTTCEGPQWRFSGGLTSGTTKDEVLGRFRQALEPRGWTLVSEPPRAVFSRQRDGKESWLELEIFGPKDVRLTLIEKGTVPRALTLPTPAAQAATWKEGELPEYLVPYPGGQLVRSRIDRTGGFEVTQPSDPERTWVGSPVWQLELAVPPDLSALEFDRVFCPALERAGWTLLHHTRRKETAGDMVFLAHFDRDGRDVWMRGHLNRKLTIMIADAGVTAASSALAEALARAGRIALYGIYFDIDQTTLKFASEATLRQVLALLEADPKLTLGIEGHTDNTGARAHNQTLSEGRAASVVAWLTQHGIASGRLTATGFADTRPVAANTTPEGRSKNRRVELARP